MAVKYPWNAVSVCCCLSMCAIVYCVWLAIHAPQLRPQEADGTPACPQG